jgi:hypothetical protein
MKGTARFSGATIDLLDQAAECCDNISTIAGLLRVAGQRPSSQPIEALLVGNAGHLIGNEIERLRELLASLRPGKTQART